MVVVATMKKAIKVRETIRVLSVLGSRGRTIPRKMGMNPIIIELIGPPITRRGTEKVTRDIERNCQSDELPHEKFQNP